MEKESWLRRWRHRALSEGGLVSLSCFSVYFAISMLLDFKYMAFYGDSVSRVANAFYVLHSRDPHLAAIGFVWNPLSSALDLPLLAFNSFWPDLASHAVAGTTMSALAMAGAAYQLNAILREWNIRALARVVMTALFALNPMILIFGGNGMSEALYLFLMLAAARYLLRWLRDGDLASLVFSAGALGFAYLERSEPVTSAAFGAVLVWAVTFRRSDGERRTRLWNAFTDSTIFVLPILTAFAGWAVVSYVITGQPFQQFTSKYGNAALIQQSHVTPGHLASRLVHELDAIEYLAPLLPLIVVAAIAVALYKKSNQILALMTILGGSVVFDLASYLNNSIFPWFRYYILIVPLSILLVASMFDRAPRAASPRRSLGSHVQVASAKTTGRAKWASVVGATALALVLLAPSIPTTARGLMNPVIDAETLWVIGPIFHVHPDAVDRSQGEAYGKVRAFAGYLDGLHLPNGSIVVDDGDSCVPNVVVNTSNPRMFVITNDRDFQRTLADPLTFGAHYLLVGGTGTQADAVAEAYPNLGKGTTWAKLVHTFPAVGNCIEFNLYRVIGHPTDNF